MSEMIQFTDFDMGSSFKAPYDHYEQVVRIMRDLKHGLREIITQYQSNETTFPYVHWMICDVLERNDVDQLLDRAVTKHGWSRARGKCTALELKFKIAPEDRLPATLRIEFPYLKPKQLPFSLEPEAFTLERTSVLSDLSRRSV